MLAAEPRYGLFITKRVDSSWEKNLLLLALKLITDYKQTMFIEKVVFLNFPFKIEMKATVLRNDTNFSLD